jgi:hypothetical protein
MVLKETLLEPLEMGGSYLMLRNASYDVLQALQEIQRSFTNPLILRYLLILPILLILLILLDLLALNNPINVGEKRSPPRAAVWVCTGRGAPARRCC